MTWGAKVTPIYLSVARVKNDYSSKSAHTLCVHGMDRVLSVVTVIIPMFIPCVKFKYSQ